MPKTIEIGSAYLRGGFNGVSSVCLDSENLSEIERRANETIKGIVKSKMSLCIALANIKRKELYRQAGILSFKAYLAERRIRINRQTAYEYAKIGEILLKYQQDLRSVDFREEDGLKKLLLLDSAVNENCARKEFLFRKLKESSYREYQKFIEAGAHSARAESLNQRLSKSWISQVKLAIGDECIVVLPLGKEIVWFDNDIWRHLDSPNLQKKFKRHILNAVEAFFLKYSSAESQRKSYDRRVANNI